MASSDLRVKLISKMKRSQTSRTYTRHTAMVPRYKPHPVHINDMGLT